MITTYQCSTIYMLDESKVLAYLTCLVFFFKARISPGITVVTAYLDVIHDERDPTTEAKHSVTNHGGTVEGAGQGLHPV